MTDPAILLLDEHIVVVDKPAGVPSVPARTPLDPPSVVERLAAGIGAVEAVHRLDRDTSGLLVLARTPDARAALGRAFEHRHVQKTYLAVVAGGLPADAGTIHLPLAADPDQPPRQRVDPILGRRAESRWRRLAEAIDGGRQLTLVALEPITGRSHQLRAHLAWLGAPIAGDPLYGAGGPTGLALHATRLSFPHPADGRPIDVHAAPLAVRPWSLFGAALLAQAWRDVGTSADAPTRDQ